MKNNGRNVSSAIMGRERCGKQMELVLTTRTPPDQLASLDLSTSTKIQTHKHKTTNIHKHTHKNTNSHHRTNSPLYTSMPGFHQKDVERVEKVKVQEVEK